MGRRRGTTVTLVGLALAVTTVCAGGGAAAAPATGATSALAAAAAVPDGHAHPRPPRPRPHPPKPPKPPKPPAYRATVSPITPRLAERMAASWRPGCPVPLEDLRYVRVSHHDMRGKVVQGELVVHADVADGIVEVFRDLFDARFPIASMRLVDDFGADDDASMAADNTSAFNCRAVTGGTGWSEHSYGRAIDVNPIENPYVRDSLVLPPAGVAFVDRPDAPGVIHDGDVVVTAFAEQGWYWGGYWTRPIDYQHFSTTNR
ncbi:M15 family metallopeptidase [Cellulomonas xiejunii]|uniref:M15 family metallopeptidase n=1 Tax=Cellulomonas xiejunii TaxID=2968083 RepID=A0ABY5KP85_9CELL|nr:M15 family metallopeptidase [Cellulomonas xiejunii]MCC2323460.1 M15 family metallopeptidase [Cellulomonas xiejunii]UUI71610.1 M15 family metallopeptidase [Cellulomonas xiejunii]